jgi:Cu/Ag efflux pump CusA
VEGLAFLVLALAATAAVFGLMHAKTWMSVGVRLGFLAMFVAGLFDLVRVMRRSWSRSARE